MSQAKQLRMDFYSPKMEGELLAICEILVRCERVTETKTHWGKRWFKFEDGSSIVFGTLGPYALN